VDANEAVTKGVYAGDQIYVGGGFHPSSGSSAPTMLYNGLCYYAWGSNEHVLNNCMYLVNQPGNFEWIPSSNGVHELGAVTYSGVPVGRVKHAGTMRVGKISTGGGRIYYTYAGKEYDVTSYEALVYKPDRLLPSESILLFAFMIKCFIFSILLA
jgi:Protein of unknown function (DUF3421)